jgi:hypothetical protein
MKEAKHIWNPCCHLAAETGSRKWQQKLAAETGSRNWQQKLAAETGSRNWQLISPHFKF